MSTGPACQHSNNFFKDFPPCPNWVLPINNREPVPSLQRDGSAAPHRTPAQVQVQGWSGTGCWEIWTSILAAPGQLGAGTIGEAESVVWWYQISVYQSCSYFYLHNSTKTSAQDIKRDKTKIKLDLCQFPLFPSSMLVLLSSVCGAKWRGWAGDWVVKVWAPVFSASSQQPAPPGPALDTPAVIKQEIFYFFCFLFSLF